MGSLSLWTNNGNKSLPKATKRFEKHVKKDKKGASREPDEFKYRKKKPNGAKRESEGHKRELKGSQREPIWSQGEPTDAKRQPKGRQKCV